MKFNELQKTVEKYMLLKDRGVVRLVCATLAGNYLPTPPNFLFIVGNSSGGKSMILQCLKLIKGVFELDDMTAQTFASGMKGQSENSLLHQLPKNGSLLIKDYTTMLSKDKETRGQILGQMRKIFDGDYRKKFGNGEDVQWQGKMGMLAGVTPAIYDQESTNANAVMGERYLYYMMEMPDRLEVGMRATEDIKDLEAKTEMTKAFDEYLNPIIDSVNKKQREGDFTQPVLGVEERKELVILAEFTTRARSGVKRNQYSRDKDQETTPDLEMTPRFAKALVCIAYGLLLLRRYDEEEEKLTEQDKAILFKIAMDSIPKPRRLVLQALTTHGSATEAGLREQLRLSDTYLKIYLHDLVAVDMVDIIKNNSGWLYILKEEYRLLMAKYLHLEMTDKVLEAEPSQEDPYAGYSL